ncbi:MAG: HIT domain-containing protein [Patescibacteria group bacterium]
MSNCLFCKIVAKTIPCEKIYEDEATFAFLDIYPLTEGMTLVVPKEHLANWWEMGEDGLATLMMSAKRVANMLKRKFPERRIGVQIEGLDVPHVHIKLLPFSTPEEFRAWPDRQKEPDHERLSALVASIIR